MINENDAGLLVESQTFNDLGRELYKLLGPGDTQLEYSVNMLRGTGQSTTRVFTPQGDFERGGERFRSTGTSVPVLKATRALRQACYREGTGTWFSATITVTAQGAANAEYNYDNEPNWDTPIDPAAYVEDQEFFPRDLSAQPQWLRQRLAEGQARIEASGNKRRRRL
ncbi:hypothetical protein [Mycetocola saprophilus]|uniref:hypothetical protein n=1 Tax=Mycetocola saprophilus TaxID=76636 RepID=UPI003BF2A4A8